MQDTREQEREELRRDGVTLLSVKAGQSVGVDQQEAWKIAEERFLHLGFPRYVGPVHLQLVRVRKRPVWARTVSWERLCWISRRQSLGVQGPRPRVVAPTYQRVGIVMVDAGTGNIRLSKVWERKP